MVQCSHDAMAAFGNQSNDAVLERTDINLPETKGRSLELQDGCCSASITQVVLLRQEEKMQLLQQLSDLELRRDLLSLMEFKAGARSSPKAPPPLDRKQGDDFEGEAAKDEMIVSAGSWELIRQRQLSLWGMHSALAVWLVRSWREFLLRWTEVLMIRALKDGLDVNPLALHIHLAYDPLLRRQTLLSIKEEALANAEQFLLSRGQLLDVLRPYHTDGRCENAQGDFCCTAFDIIQFEDVHSVRQVWDALLFFLDNIEISVSENLGEVTLREDSEAQDEGIAHHRLVSLSRSGITEEINRVHFTRCTEAGRGGQHQWLQTSQFVDIDDLYPYSPDTFMRKDVTAALSLTPHWRKHAGGNEDELVVVLQRAAFIKLHRPRTPVPNRTLREQQEGCMRWGDVMIKSIRGQLYPVLA